MIAERVGLPFRIAAKIDFADRGYFKERIAPLLWNGTTPFRFLTRASAVALKQPVAVWRAKIQTTVMDALAEKGSPLIEVEDGFLRSRGLGADCIPPLSIVTDRLGPHFDPSHPSELEL